MHGAAWILAKREQGAESPKLFCPGRVIDWHLFSSASSRCKHQLIHSCVSLMKYHLIKSLWVVHSLSSSFLTKKCLRLHASRRPFDCSLEMLFSFLIRIHQKTVILFSLKQLPALEDRFEAKTGWTPYSPISNTNNQNLNCRWNTSQSREPQGWSYSWKSRAGKGRFLIFGRSILP